MRCAYPYQMESRPEGGFTVTFPDVPEARTEGSTLGEARARAETALVTALSFYTDDSRPLPEPTLAHGRPVVVPPPLVSAKLALHSAMLAAEMSALELGRRLGCDANEVRELLDPLHRSHIEQVEAALRVLGKRIEVLVLEAI